MALTANQTTELAEILTEITQLENRFAVIHGLGDNNSSGGLTTSFADNANWQRRLNLLRVRRNQLVAMRDGTDGLMSADIGSVRGNYLG